MRSLIAHRWGSKVFAVTMTLMPSRLKVLTHKKHVEKLRYIHRNPVERGLAEKPEDWPWSSFRHYLRGEQGHIEIESDRTWNRREREANPPIAIEPR